MSAGETKIVVFTLASGEAVPVEVEPVRAGLNFQPVSRDAAAGDLPKSFAEALARVRPLADAVIETLSGLAARPDQVEIQFGIKLNAVAGAVIAKAGTEANFAVKLNWKRAEPVPRKRYGKR